MSLKKVKTFLQYVKERNPYEPEFHQAVQEFAEEVIPFVEKNKKYQGYGLLERMCEPDRVISFRVTWTDDTGKIQVNRGYRVQFNMAIGPYKGGLRFHPSVNLSILKFLGFEQTFKNSLTTLPMGGGKGGSDFNPRGKSDSEVMRFCQSFMNELYRHIAPNSDVPAGDIGVGGREIGFLFGQYKRITKEHTGVFTGKGFTYGGSRIRPEATGYGNVYFAQEMLKTKGESLDGKTCLVSGSGNVAQYTIEKILELGGKVFTVSDSSGCIYDEEGIDSKKLAFIQELKNEKRGRIKEYIKKYKKAKYTEGATPWEYKADCAFPSATQNELGKKDAETLVKNGVQLVGEGANMPCTIDAIKAFQKAKVLYSPGKASNAGGVATSGLEMSQNSLRMQWSREKVDQELKTIMKDIHEQCVKYGRVNKNYVDYVKGANIGGFVKVADAMIGQGIV